MLGEEALAYCVKHETFLIASGFPLFSHFHLYLLQRGLLNRREHETVATKIWGERERFCWHPMSHRSSPPPLLLVLGEVPDLEPFAKLSLLPILKDLKQTNKTQSKTTTNKKAKQTKTTKKMGVKESGGMQSREQCLNTCLRRKFREPLRFSGAWQNLLPLKFIFFLCPLSAGYAAAV